MNPTDLPKRPMLSVPLPANRSLGLGTKFMLSFCFVLVIACSALSWYYVEVRRAAMTDHLLQLGTILLTSVVQNEHFHYAGLVAEDPTTLQQFIDGLVAVQDVVYVVITDSDGNLLAQRTKGSRRSSDSLVRSVDHPLYPDNQIAKQLYHSSNPVPLMTRLSLPNQLSNPFFWEEIVYDFAMPVLRTAEEHASPAPFPEEGNRNSSPPQPALVSGVVQIGLTDAHLNHELETMVKNILVFTAFIIGAGALYAHLLTLRITKPLWLPKWLKAGRLRPSHPPAMTKWAN